jgi:hypothetical protein
MPSFVRAHAYQEHLWGPENVRPALPRVVTSSPLQRPATPNGPRAPLTARPSTPRMQNYPHSFRRFEGAARVQTNWRVSIFIDHTNEIDSPKLGPKEGRSTLLRRCTSFVQPPRRPPELNLRHPSPSIPSRTNPRPRSPGPTPRIPFSPFVLPRVRLASLRHYQDRHPLRPDSRANVNPIKYEIKKKLKERRKACHDHTTSDSSAKFDPEEFFSSLTSD